MSDSKKENWGAELRETLNELALRTLLGDDGDPANTGTEAQAEEVVRALQRISELAGRTEQLQLAAMAEKLAAGPPEEFGEGVRRLQDALASEEPDGGPVEECHASSPALPSLLEDEELVSDFILESREHLANVETQLLTLEREPGNPETLHSAFRSFHTIKGLAGFLELAEIQEVAHEMETILDLARQQKLRPTAEVVDAVLAGSDYLRVAVDSVEESMKTRHRPAFSECTELIERVRGVASEDGAETEDPKPAGVAAETKDRAKPTRSGALEPPGSESAPKSAPDGPNRASRTELAAPDTAQSKAHRTQAQAVKVHTGKLDYLVDMVGELVVAQSLLKHDPDVASLKSSRLQRNLSQLSRITTDVQRTAMSMRMVPVGTLFRRYTRLVRDLARNEGKIVELVTRGEDTELDRNIIEELADPLMHMIRNGINHGLETPVEREAGGKPPQGRVQLSAWHQSGFIMIELSDDGRGISSEKVLRKAQQLGLVPEGAELSEAEIQNLIFEPGFTTADQVSNVSGRGVGMDVVKRNILKLRGRVEVRSAEGQGTSFTLKMPLTLAIIEGMIVGVGKERYIVPIYTVREMLRPTPEQLSSVHGREEMVTVRGRLFPLVRLHKCFGVEPLSENPADSLLLVAETLGKRFCLLVDQLIGKQEVVIKSLGESLKNVSGVAGGAILGEGTVGLILDMDGIFAGGADG